MVWFKKKRNKKALLSRVLFCYLNKTYAISSLTSAAKFFGSNLIPGPIVVDRYTDLTNVPFAEDGFDLNTASANVA